MKSSMLFQNNKAMKSDTYTAKYEKHEKEFIFDLFTNFVCFLHQHIYIYHGNRYVTI